MCKIESLHVIKCMPVLPYRVRTMYGAHMYHKHGRVSALSLTYVRT